MTFLNLGIQDEPISQGGRFLAGKRSEVHMPVPALGRTWGPGTHAPSTWHSRAPAPTQHPHPAPTGIPSHPVPSQPAQPRSVEQGDRMGGYRVEWSRKPPLKPHRATASSSAGPGSEHLCRDKRFGKQSLGRSGRTGFVESTGNGWKKGRT